MYIDDLDRCSKGKSVQILEAVQLLFNETLPERSESAFDAHSGWLMFCAKMTVSWQLLWLWVRSGCNRCGCRGSGAWSVRDGRHTRTTRTANLWTSPSATSRRIRRLVQSSDRDLEEGREENNNPETGGGPRDGSSATSEASETLDKAPFITVFVSGACLSHGFLRWPGWMPGSNPAVNTANPAASASTDD